MPSTSGPAARSASARTNGAVPDQAREPVQGLPGLTARRVRLHGDELYVREAGAGPVLLLLHGLAGSGSTFDPVLPLLAEHARVVVPDLLGHGSSAKPRADYSMGAHAGLVRDLLTVLGYDRVTVVGHSLGGGVAMQLAYQHPETVERLVLVASGGLGHEVSLLLRAATVPGAELVLPLLTVPLVRWSSTMVARGVGRLPFVSRPAVDELIRQYELLSQASGRAAFLATLRGVVDPLGQRASATGRLYLAEELPTLLVWGDHDHIIPVAHAHATHAALPGSRLTVLPGAGHFPHRADPARFADELLDFLAGTEPAVNDRDAVRARLLRLAAEPRG